MNFVVLNKADKTYLAFSKSKIPFFTNKVDKAYKASCPVIAGREITRISKELPGVELTVETCMEEKTLG